MKKTLHPYHERVLDRLRQCGDGGAPPLSIAADLGMNRKVVNQAVYELRQLGYRIVRRDALVLVKEPEDQLDR